MGWEPCFFPEDLLLLLLRFGVEIGSVARVRFHEGHDFSSLEKVFLMAHLCMRKGVQASLP